MLRLAIGDKGCAILAVLAVVVTLVGFGAIFIGELIGGNSVDNATPAPIFEVVTAPTLQPTPTYAGPTADDYLRNIVVTPEG